MPSTFTTKLPDEDQPALGNGVEDEVAIDRQTATTNYGDVRLQIRETGESAWDSSATGFAEQTIAYDTLTTQFIGREDGERYEVRARTETEHATGSWAAPVAIITKFPGVANLTIVAGPTSADLSWDDRADNELGQEAIRERRGPDGEWWPETLVEDVGANTESYTDDTVQPDTEYRYRIRAYTDDTSATSKPATVTTDSLGLSRRRVPATGWYVEIDHPATTGALTPTVLIDGVRYPHRINALPTVAIPVPKSSRWLDDEQLEEAPMHVWKDGVRLPIDTLENVRERPEKVILEGAGGKALEQRVQVEYTDKAAHVAVDELLSDIGIPHEVDDPATQIQTDDRLLTADETDEWTDLLNGEPAPDRLPTVSDGALTQHQSAWFVEAEDADTTKIVEGQLIDAGQFSGSQIPYIVDQERNGAPGEFSHTFTVEHEIPAGEAVVGVRVHNPDYRPFHGFEIRVDGETIFSATPGDPSTTLPTPRWEEETANIGGLTPGEYEVTYILTEQYTGDGGDPINAVDCLALWDNRHADGFGNDVTEGVLSGDLYADGIEQETDDVVSFLSIVAGELTSTWNDLSGDQAVALSNDLGSTWYEASNSDTIDADFDSGSAQIRARFTLGGYDADPSTSPAGRTAPHRVDLANIFADLDDTPRLINKTYSGSAIDTLQDIAADHSLFGLEWDDDAEAVSVIWTQPGLRTSDVNAPVTDYEAAKVNEDSYERVVLRGQSKRVEEEELTPAPTAPIENDPIVEGSGRVYDDTTTYVEDEDYRLSRLGGELEILDSGEMVAGDTYRIDYEYNVSGSYAPPGAPADAKTLEEEIASLPSARGCELAALYLYRRVDEPLIEAEVDLAELDPTQLIVESIDVEGIPTAGDPVKIREYDGSQQNPSLRLGNRRSASEVVDDIRSQLQAVTRRV